MKAITKLIDDALEFDEDAFRSEWCIRGVGMGMPLGAMHGARCFHTWKIKNSELIRLMKDVIANAPQACTCNYGDDPRMNDHDYYCKRVIGAQKALRDFLEKKT